MAKKRNKFLQSPEWEAILHRLRQVIGTKDVQKTAYSMGLHTFRLDLVLLGHKGFTIDSLIRTCRAFDLSPNWVLLNRGSPDLTGEPISSRKKIDRLRRRINKRLDAMDQKTREEFEQRIIELLERLNEK